MASSHIESINEKVHKIIIEYGKDPATGKRKRIKKTFHGKKSDEQKELTRMLNEIEQGLFVEPNKILFSDFMKKWPLKLKLRLKHITVMRKLLRRASSPTWGRFRLPNLSHSTCRTITPRCLPKAGPIKKAAFLKPPFSSTTELSIRY